MAVTEHQTQMRIKITRNGPYVVSGNVPLTEKIITPNGRGYVLRPGRDLPQAAEYSLCRCGQSKTPPFCDGSHIRTRFEGTETASMDSYDARAELLEGPTLDLLDDGRCAYARFCHRENGNAWELTERSDRADNKGEAIQAACECPTGRLVALEKSGQRYELEYPPGIEIAQDPEQHVSGGIWVKGYITIESADGRVYEARSRVALCRCGKSRIKPFCDAMHVPARFKDGGA